MNYNFLKELERAVRKGFKHYKNSLKVKGKTKYFCIGMNKTGTTSIHKAFEDLGFIVGDQRVAEILYDKHYFKKEFQPIIDYCKTAQVFQDVPFSCPETFQYLDQAYPNSKFILTIRDDAEQWYSSMTQFHTKLYSSSKNPPTFEDLSEAWYIRKGYPLNLLKLYKTPENDPYKKEMMITHYNRYNQEVMEYFKDRSDDLLVINVADANLYPKFTQFINVDSPHTDFPWENKT